MSSGGGLTNAEEVSCIYPLEQNDIGGFFPYSPKELLIQTQKSLENRRAITATDSSSSGKKKSSLKKDQGSEEPLNELLDRLNKS